MMNDECRIKNSESRTRTQVRCRAVSSYSAFCILHSAFGSDLHDGLNYTRLRLRVRLEYAGHGVEGAAVGDPRAGVDPPVLDQPDDAGEVLRQGVAAGQQRPLGAVEGGVRER